MANPLSTEDRANIEIQLKALADARADLNRAKAAGIDVADLEKQLNESEAQLKAIKQVYFPTGRAT